MISRNRKTNHYHYQSCRTQSFLSKYGVSGSKGKQENKALMSDAFTQTSDNESDNYELSAMEKDILQATGQTPSKLKLKIKNINQINRQLFQSADKE